MKNNFPKIQLILSVIFCLLFSFAFVFLYRATNSNNQKAEENTITWQAETHRRDNIRSLDRTLQQIASQRVLLENHFAKSSDVVPFLNTVEKLAGEAGTVSEINSVNVVSDNTKLIVGFKVSGSFEAIYKFLTLLENSPYETDFLSMDIHNLTVQDSLGTAVRSLKWEAIFSIQLLSFSFYYFK